MNSTAVYYFYFAVVLIMGLVVGSFLNVLVLRIDNLKSVLNSRSQCPKCLHKLSWLDLFPVFSYLFLGGKCRYCKKKISVQYPLVELGTALVFGLLYFKFSGELSSLIYYIILFSTLLVVFVYDFRTQYVPQNFVYVAILTAMLGSFFNHDLNLISVLLGGLIGGGIPAILVFASREKWMGSGDIGVGFVLGLIVGFPASVFGFFLACLLGSIVGIVLMVLKNKTIKDRLAFAPFLIASALISLIWGQAVINWYLNII